MKLATEFDLLDPRVLLVTIEFPWIVFPPIAELVSPAVGFIFEDFSLVNKDLLALRVWSKNCESGQKEAEVHCG